MVQACAYPEQVTSLGFMERLHYKLCYSPVIERQRRTLHRFTDIYAPELRQQGLFSEIVSKRPHLGMVSWPDGGCAQVFVSRHMRFFGKLDGGEMFRPLRQALA